MVGGVVHYNGWCPDYKIRQYKESGDTGTGSMFLLALLRARSLYPKTVKRFDDTKLEFFFSVAILGSQKW